MLNKFFEEIKKTCEKYGEDYPCEYWATKLECGEHHDFTIEFDCYGDVCSITQNW